MQVSMKISNLVSLYFDRTIHTKQRGTKKITHIDKLSFWTGR